MKSYSLIAAGLLLVLSSRFASAQSGDIFPTPTDLRLRSKAAHFPYLLRGVGPGATVRELYEGLGASPEDAGSCLYDRSRFLASCRLVLPKGLWSEAEADTVRFDVERSTGIVTNLEVWGRVPAENFGSAFSAAQSELSAAWGETSEDALFANLDRCVGWEAAGRGAGLCRLPDQPVIQVILYDSGLREMVEKLARNEPQRRLNPGTYHWWPFWEPFELAGVWPGLRAGDVLAAFQPQFHHSCEEPEFALASQANEAECTWERPRVRIAGREAYELTLHLDTETERVSTIQLAFGPLPNREAAEALANEMTDSLAASWGPPRSRSEGRAEWKRLPFRAAVDPLCWNNCDVGEPWQVWVSVTGLEGGGARDEADLSEPYF